MSPSESSNTPAEIANGLAELFSEKLLRDLVDRVASCRALTADGLVAGYVGVRPASNGTISMYVHKGSVSFALQPELAQRLASQFNATLRRKNPTTWFMRLTADQLASADRMNSAVEVGIAAVDKSELGPAYEGGEAATVALRSAKPICDRCRQYELAANGTCICDD